MATCGLDMEGHQAAIFLEYVEGESLKPKLVSTTAEPGDLFNQSGTSSGTALPTAQ